MVDVEHAQVALPTVDARVSQKVVADEFESTSACGCRPRDDQPDVTLAVVGVVATSPGSVAVAADILESVGRGALAVEGGEWLLRATQRAALHDGPVRWTTVKPL